MMMLLFSRLSKLLVLFNKFSVDKWGCADYNKICGVFFDSMVVRLCNRSQPTKSNEKEAEQ